MTSLLVQPCCIFSHYTHLKIEKPSRATMLPDKYTKSNFLPIPVLSLLLTRIQRTETAYLARPRKAPNIQTQVSTNQPQSQPPLTNPLYHLLPPSLHPFSSSHLILLHARHYYTSLIHEFAPSLYSHQTIPVRGCLWDCTPGAVARRDLCWSRLWMLLSGC